MRFYVDTSVWGGIQDAEFAEWTEPLFANARQGLYKLVLSDVTLAELQNAPPYVRDLPTSIPDSQLELVSITPVQLALADCYVRDGALPAKFHADAQHIAIASVLHVDSLLSWNFKHMVNFFRIRQYNAINAKQGYPLIDIRTPREITYEN